MSPPGSMCRWYRSQIQQRHKLVLQTQLTMQFSTEEEARASRPMTSALWNAGFQGQWEWQAYLLPEPSRKTPEPHPSFSPQTYVYAELLNVVSGR